jgi:hypothetical protein
MDHSQDRVVDDPEHPDVDSRTLVTALTQLLLEDPTPTLAAGEQAEPDLRSPNHATDTADATLREITSSRSLSVLPDERETSPLLPAFLSDSQVRTALQRANSLRPQGHLSDEPQFPSSLTNAQSQFQAERDWREVPARPPYPIIGYTDSSYPSNVERSGDCRTTRWACQVCSRTGNSFGSENHQATALTAKGPFSPPIAWP